MYVEGFVVCLEGSLSLSSRFYFLDLPPVFATMHIHFLLGEQFMYILVLEDGAVEEESFV